MVCLFPTTIIWPCVTFLDSDVASPDSDIREDLEQQLKLNLKHIKKHYASFVSCLCESIVQKGVSVGQLKVYILGLISSEDDVCELVNRINETDTIHKIFNLLLLEYASFFNYDIFQSILEKYYDLEDQEKFQYKKHFKFYIDTHTVSNFIAINPRLEKFTDVSQSDKITLKFDIKLTDKISKVFDCKGAVASILGIPTSALRLLSIEEGCVIVTFLIPESIANGIITTEKKFTTEEVEEFRTLSILWLKYGSFTFDFKKEVLSDSDTQKYDTQIIIPGQYINAACNYIVVNCRPVGLLCY